MKKISMISMLSVLTVPAFAQTEANVLYGDPANIQQAVVQNVDMVQPVEQQLDAQQAKERNINSKETKKVEEVKTEKIEQKKTKKIKNRTSQVKEKQTKVYEVQEQPIESTKEQQFESKTFSNPDIKFPHGLQFGGGISTTSGLNGFVGYNNKKFDSFWWKRLGFRLDFAKYSPIKSSLNSNLNDYIGDKGIEINNKLTIKDLDMDGHHFGAMIDFYPFGDTWFLGGWRVSGGYMTGNLDLNASIKGNEKIGEIEFDLGGHKYKYLGNEMQGKANVNWKYSGPYLGTGFDFGLVAGLKMYFDAGVVFTNSHAKIDLNVPITNLQTIGGIDVSDNPAAAPEVQAAYAQFEEAKAKATDDAQKELNKLDYFPIVKIGLMYRF